MIAFVLVYVCIGLLVEYGFHKYCQNDSGIDWILSAIVWPVVFTDKYLVECMYLGWSKE